MKIFLICLVLLALCYSVYAKNNNDKNSNRLNDFQFNSKKYENIIPKSETDKIIQFDSIISKFLKNDYKKISEFYDSVCAIASYLYKEDSYYATPPEFIPFATMGSDGHMYGFLVLAPELEKQSAPIASYVPIDNEGVNIEAGNFVEFIDNNITFTSEEFGFEDLLISEKKLKALFSLLKNNGFSNLTERAVDRYNDESEASELYTNFIPSLPDGYKYLNTSDNIGILAKNQFFDPSDPHPKYSNNFELFYKTAISAYSKKYYATALYYLKELYYHENLAKSKFTAVVEELKKVYKAMGRDIFIDTLDNNLKNYAD